MFLGCFFILCPKEHLNGPKEHLNEKKNSENVLMQKKNGKNAPFLIDENLHKSRNWKKIL